MEKRDLINILLIEDEEFDVQRVRRTVSYYDSRIKILDVVSNGRAALELIKENIDKLMIMIIRILKNDKINEITKIENDNL